MAASLAVNGVLKKTALSSNTIKDEGASALGQGLKDSKMLEELNLLSCSIGPAGAQGLAEGLFSSALTSLDLPLGASSAQASSSSAALRAPTSAPRRACSRSPPDTSASSPRRPPRSRLDLPHLHQSLATSSHRNLPPTLTDTALRAQVGAERLLAHIAAAAGVHAG